MQVLKYQKLILNNNRTLPNICDIIDLAIKEKI